MGSVSKLSDPELSSDTSDINRMYSLRDAFSDGALCVGALREVDLVIGAFGGSETACSGT